MPSWVTRRLIYATRSATPDDRRWRVLIPLAEPLAGADYETRNGVLRSARGARPQARPRVGPGRAAGLPAEPGEHYERDEADGPLDLTDHPIIRRRDDAAADAGPGRRRRPRSRRGPSAAPGERGRRADRASSTGAHRRGMLSIYGYSKAPATTGSRPTSRAGASRPGTTANTGPASRKATPRRGSARRQGAASARGDAFDLYAQFEHRGDFTPRSGPTGRSSTRGAGARRAGGPGFDWSNGRRLAAGSAQAKPSGRTSSRRTSRAAAAADVGGGIDFLKGALWLSTAVLPVLDGAWLIRDWIPSRGLSVIFGASGAGKSHMAGRHGGPCRPVRGVARQVVEPGLVVYIALEGHGSLPNRIAALARSFGDAPVWFIRARFSLAEVRGPRRRSGGDHPRGISGDGPDRAVGDYRHTRPRNGRDGGERRKGHGNKPWPGSRPSLSLSTAPLRRFTTAARTSPAESVALHRSAPRPRPR